MTACEFDRRLKAWCDGELPASEAAAVEAHVERCSVCAHSVTELRAISGALQSDLAVLSPQALDVGRVLEQAGKVRADDARTLRLVRRVAAVAAVVLASTLLVQGLTREPRPFLVDESGSSIDRQVDADEDAIVGRDSSTLDESGARVDPEYAWHAATPVDVESQLAELEAVVFPRGE